MAITPEEHVARAIARVPTMGLQDLQTTRGHALKFGDIAADLVALIDERLLELKSEGGIAAQRLEFARGMLRIVQRGSTQWVPGRDVFNRAKVELAHNPFVIWMKGNGAREIPITKALDDVLPEFPDVERRKDGLGQSDRVFFRRKPS